MDQEPSAPDGQLQAPDSDDDVSRTHAPSGDRRTPALLIVLGVLLVLLLLDVAGFSIVREWPAPTARAGPSVAAPTARVGEGSEPQSPLPLQAEDASPSTGLMPKSPSPRGVPPHAPASAALSPSEAPSSPRAVPSATNAPRETPQEVVVRTPDEAPREIQTTPQLVGPPDGAHVVPDDDHVTLGWPAGSAHRWHVDVTAQGRAWYTQDVATPGVTFRVEAGPTYQWRVVAQDGGGEVVPWRSFQVLDGRLVDFHGQDGASRFPGATAGDAGGRGQDGANGQDLEVWVERVDGFIRVRIETVRGSKETLYLLPSSPPVTVSAAGGRGGRGGQGANGMGALVNTRSGPVMAVGNGANGGEGGNGGNGGNIRLHAPADLEKYVAPDVAGGDGGSGGAGGGGSIGAPGRNDTVVYGPPGSAGASGRSGQPGQPGKLSHDN